MRRTYLSAGLVVAGIVFAGVVFAGYLDGRSSTSASGGQAALPAGHPTLTPEVTATASSPTDQYTAQIGPLQLKHQKDPADTKVTLALADAYLMSEHANKAMPLYADVLRRQPGNVQATAQQAIAYHVKGNDAMALQLLAGLIAADPSSQIAHYNLAIVYFSQDKTAQARQEWQTTARLDPTSRLGASAQSYIDLMDSSSPTPSGQ